MDVRCERCLTEYELEDESVSESGTSVQCTSCDHTFLVHRPPKQPAVATAPGGVAIAPATTEWMVEMVQGQVHRFRELSDLHRWIVERKVTRRDRISRTGQTWRLLDDIVELKPFFDITEEADRARAAATHSRSEVRTERLPAEVRAEKIRPEKAVPTLGLGAQARTARSSYGPFPTPAKGVSTTGARTPSLAKDVDTSVVRRRGRLGRVVVTFGVAAGVAYYGITHLPPVIPAEKAPFAFPGAVKGAAWTQLPSRLPEAPVETAAALPSDIAPARAAPPPASGETIAAKPTAPGPSYAELVTEAFRMLDNGALTRARKLLESALELRPEGAEALAGMGYVHLDRNKFPSAIDYFKRALAENSHPAALFGLGEAYRYAGERKRAVEAYKRFLAVAPKDRDAAVARKQIRALSGGTRSSEVAPASSILQEGAR